MALCHIRILNKALQMLDPESTDLSNLVCKQEIGRSRDPGLESDDCLPF